jgi:hypothetical protein
VTQDRLVAKEEPRTLVFYCDAHIARLEPVCQFLGREHAVGWGGCCHSQK